MNDTKTFFINGKIVMGYKCPDGDILWLRDHTHQIKAYKYWETDMKSLVDYFLNKQLPNGSFAVTALRDQLDLGKQYGRDWVRAHTGLIPNIWLNRYVNSRLLSMHWLAKAILDKAKRIN